MQIKRVLLKISGEALGGKGEMSPIDSGKVQIVAEQIAEVRAGKKDIQIAIVVGGGNIFRGMKKPNGSKGVGKTLETTTGIERATGDYMGMLATTINALALQSALEKLGVQTRVQSAITMTQVAEPYIRRRAIRHLEKGRVVIFAGGTGNPYFTTDTAAALRANEIDADVILKATDVDGIYESDPKINPKAKRFITLNYRDALRQSDKIKVMDTTAFSLCMDNKKPIIVYELFHPHNLKTILIKGQKIGTFVSDKKTELSQD